jgi:hypothetical protein
LDHIQETAMSLIADIREHMARQSGPVHPKQVAEALEQELATVRTTMNQASTKGYGIERLDDGTFSLIPGWVPARGPNAAAVPAAAEPPAGKAKAPAKGKVRGGGRKAKAIKPAKTKRAYVRKPKAAAPKAMPARKAPARAATAAAATGGERVSLTRTSLDALVQGVLASETPITPALRSALREATSRSAHA